MNVAPGSSATPVWVNELGGVTWRLPGSYVKTGPGRHLPEAERLTWLGTCDLPFAVPRVLSVGEDHLQTASLTGAPPLHPADPGAAAQALGRALRTFHDAVPVDQCPFVWSPLRGDEDLVVCHGDACPPNWLFGPALEFVGAVDLGSLGLADRWVDIAPALDCLPEDGMAGQEAEFLRGYGIEMDAEKYAFYLDKWNTTD
ncbi:phosphotransferase [Corynebacterium nasicanis]|uniref:Phosphotransferase n=1 Tax=Corynebacterium nasicanis TaxID=1448267 RepID=A0ABW1QBM3_9CORY